MLRVCLVICLGVHLLQKQRPCEASMLVEHFSALLGLLSAGAELQAARSSIVSCLMGVLV
jgi:hypothetical protein